jgi:hypothetical protein
MERLLTELVDKLVKAHGDAVISITLYGSSAIGSNRDAFSDYNVLCVLNDITPHRLALSEPIFRWWRDHKNPAPLLLSEREVATSADSFPIEFHDIRAQRRILHGRDVFAELHIDDRYYRAMVEHELRAKLLRLRTKAGGILSDRELLLELMADSVTTFCVLLRHAIVLEGGEPIYERRAMLAEAARRFGLDAKPFHALLDLRESKVRPKDLQPSTLFAEYLKQIQTAVEGVDRIHKEA